MTLMRLLVLFVLCTDAQILYVELSGSASSPTCSRQNPCSTIARALLVAGQQSQQVATVSLSEGSFAGAVSSVSSLTLRGRGNSTLLTSLITTMDPAAHLVIEDVRLTSAVDWPGSRLLLRRCLFSGVILPGPIVRTSGSNARVELNRVSILDVQCTDANCAPLVDTGTNNTWVFRCLLVQSCSGTGNGILRITGAESVSVFDSEFRGSTVAEAGALWVERTPVIAISNSSFLFNSAGGITFRGGAIGIGSGWRHFEVRNSVFQGNNVTGPSGDGGALGISNPGGLGRLVVHNSFFEDNTVADDGAAIYISLAAGFPGSVSLQSSTFRGNIAGQTGAIRVNLADPMLHVVNVTDCVFEDNSGADEGAGLTLRGDGSALISGVTQFSRNSPSALYGFASTQQLAVSGRAWFDCNAVSDVFCESNNADFSALVSATLAQYRVACGVTCGSPCNPGAPMCQNATLPVVTQNAAGVQVCPAETLAPAVVTGALVIVGDAVFSADTEFQGGAASVTVSGSATLEGQLVVHLQEIPQGPLVLISAGMLVGAFDAILVNHSGVNLRSCEQLVATPLTSMTTFSVTVSVTSSCTNVGLIAGAAAGGVVFLAVLISVIGVCAHRRRSANVWNNISLKTTNAA